LEIFGKLDNSKIKAYVERGEALPSYTAASGLQSLRRDLQILYEETQRKGQGDVQFVIKDGPNRLHRYAHSAILFARYNSLVESLYKSLEKPVSLPATAPIRRSPYGQDIDPCWCPFSSFYSTTKALTAPYKMKFDLSALTIDLDAFTEFIRSLYSADNVFKHGVPVISPTTINQVCKCFK
jgi:hypothetical protein